MVIIAVSQNKITTHVYEFPLSGDIGRWQVDGQQPLDISPLGEIVFSLRHSIRLSDEVRTRSYLEKLYNLLIEPLQTQEYKLNDFRKLIVVPHGILHYIPFAALIGSGGRHLIEEISLTTVPSASVLFRILGNSRKKANTFVGFAAPVLQYPLFAPLHDAERELDRIAQLVNRLRVEVFKKENANEETFRRFVYDRIL